MHTQKKEREKGGKGKREKGNKEKKEEEKEKLSRPILSIGRQDNFEKERVKIN